MRRLLNNRGPMWMSLMLGLLVTSVTTGHADSRPAVDDPSWTMCRSAAKKVSQAYDLPTNMLAAISLTETGRMGPTRRDSSPWPWTINSGGRSLRFATRDDAVRAARQMLARGNVSIDVGCMQINMKYHPRAFTSIEEAFDPLANMTYAAEFLNRLKKQYGSWDMAIQRYHGADLEKRSAYKARFEERLELERTRPARLKKWGLAPAARRIAGRDLPQPEVLTQAPPSEWMSLRASLALGDVAVTSAENDAGTPARDPREHVAVLGWGIR